MRYEGKITEWRDIRGFGFITPKGRGERVFVHLNAFTAGQQRPQGRERVSYELGKDSRGRVCARNVAFLDRRLHRLQPSGADFGAVIASTLFLLALAGAVLLGKLPWPALAVYAGLSLLTYREYALDKAAALAGRWRTAESTLLTWGFLGGWPGALIAQRRLRHKSRKQPFQLLFWLTVFVNCGMLLGLGTPFGRSLILALLRGPG